uniref:SH2 domain-containing protein n=1 Tax=Panagrellus redivivus TaxID=6233 RepID=A0A7E4V8G9_PANRE
MSRNRNDQKSNPREVSPPSYSVIEDSRGELVNRDLNVKWPQRPRTGHHSLGEYLRRRETRHKSASKRSPDEESSQKRSSKEKSDKSDATDKTDRTDEQASPPAVASPSECVRPDWPKAFSGISPSHSMKERLRPTRFLLYYCRPDALLSLNDVPVCLPLMVAYMSSKGVLYNFGVEKERDKQGTMWRVVMGDGPPEPGFRSLAALVKYYQTYGELRPTGECENFSVP